MADGNGSAPRAENSPAAIWAAMAAIYVIWGSTYLAIRVAVETLPPLLMASVRFLVAGGLLYAWAIRRGARSEDRPTARQWRASAIVGTALLLGGNGGVVLAEQTVPSGIAALLVAT
ncbi:MAG TPA: EamA family transporter, partial [Actinomycetota bacterium]|nr:EamA family transporter [Actinomycetota bacterium]